MITIDSRVGSKDLMAYLPQRLAKLGRLEYGDASWIGNGPGGMPLMAGMERKKLHDAISSMESGRFAGHQLPGLRASFQVIYLVVEGIWRANPRSGILETPRGKGWVPIEHGQRRYMERELSGWLNTQEMLGGVRVRQTGTARQTALLLTSLHHWWVDKAWEEHRSHLALDNTLDTGGRGLLVKPSRKRMIACQLPHIGWKRSQAVEDYFETVREMMNADEEVWMGIEGIDKGIARQVVEAIREGR